jgi:hypothetical protein
VLFLMRYKTKHYGDGVFGVQEEHFGTVVDPGPYDYDTALRKSDLRNEDLIRRRLGR